MRASSIIAVAATSLAAAAPATPQHGHKEFAVSDFIFGCTSGCYWYFDLDVKNFGKQYAVPDAPAKCQGSLEDTALVSCNTNSSLLYDLAAYIEKDNDELHLQYTFYDHSNNATRSYNGQTRVYAATNDPEHKQKPAFTVPVTSTQTGVFGSY